MYFSLQLLNFHHFVINKHNCIDIFGRVLNYINNVCVKFECSAFKSFWIVNFSENTKTHTDRERKLWILFHTGFCSLLKVSPIILFKYGSYLLENPVNFSQRFVLLLPLFVLHHHCTNCAIAGHSCCNSCT